MRSDPAPERVRLVGVHGPSPGRVRLQRGSATAIVDVADADDRYAAVVEATLEGLARLLPPMVSFSFERSALVPGERPVLVVVVVMTVAGMPLHHTGSAFVGDDADTAAAKATLSAVNRRLEILGL